MQVLSPTDGAAGPILFNYAARRTAGQLHEGRRVTGMSHSDNIVNLGKGSELQFSAPLTIVASSAHIEALRAGSGAEWVSDAEFITQEPGEPLPEEQLPQNGIVIFEVDPHVPSSMQRIRQLHRLRPNMPQIVAMRDVDLKLVRTLVREGVADVVELPFHPEEIIQTLVAVLETHREAVGAEVELAPTIAVSRALGRSGATTIASHLAAELVKAHGRSSVCIIDLDIQSGRMAEVLGLSPRRNLTDLLDAGSRRDSALLHTVAETHSSGIDLVAAPSDILPIEAVDAENLLQLIELARREYEYVILDLPSNLTNWTLKVLAQAQSVMMVVELNLASLRQAKRRLDLFRTLGLDPHLVSIVVNRVEKKLFGGIRLSDVESALGKSVFATMSLDQKALEAAQDQGVLAGAIRRRSPFLADAVKLAELIDIQLSETER